MTRIQLRLQGPAEQIFLKLSERLQAKDKDLILDSLALLHFAAEQISDGRKIGSYDPENREFTALTTPTLEALAARTSEREKQLAPAAMAR